MSDTSIGRRLGLVLLVAAGLPLAQALNAQETGALVGQIIAERDGRPLSGADVSIPALGEVRPTDQFGRFNFGQLPAGSHTLEVRLLGRTPAERVVQVEAGGTTSIEIQLAVEPLELAGISVTSEKFVRDLQETQTSVGALSDTEMSAVPVRDWEDAMLLVGNVSTSGSGVFSVRGIPNTGLGGGGGSPTAALYVDGVQQGRFTTSRTIRGTWDLESVEVFRGPQSTLSGRNALAGAVYLRSAAPSFEYGAAARLRGGDQEVLDGAVMVTGPLVDDQLAFRISGEVGTEDKALTFVNIDNDLDGFERTTTSTQHNIKSRLLFTPTALPDLSALVNYTYAYDRPVRFQGATGQPSADGHYDYGERESQVPMAIFDEATHHNASLEIGYDLSPSLSLTSLTASGFAEYHIDGLSYQTDDPEIIVPLAQRSSTDEATVTQELRVNYETTRTRAVLGAYFGHFGSDRTRNDSGDVWALARPSLEAHPQVQELLMGEPLPRFGIIFESRSRDDHENENLALFGEVNHEVTDGFTLTAGLRYDDETVESTARTLDIGGRFEDAPPALAPFEEQVIALIVSEVNTDDEDLSTDFGVFLPKVGTVVDLSDDVSIGATVQRGYRAGGAQSLTIGDVNIFDPEFTWNYELSFRNRLLGGRLTANANLFYTDWTDQQVLVPQPENPNPAFARVENAGESTLYGGEIELRAVAAPGLTLFSSIGVTHSEFDQFISNGRDLAGFEFPGAPGETLSAGAIFDRGEGPFGAVNASYVGEHYSQVGTRPVGGGSFANDPDLRAGDYAVVDAQVGYSFRLGGSNTRVTAFARNLLDELGLDSVGFNTFGLPEAQLRAPRTVGVSLGVEF